MVLRDPALQRLRRRRVPTWWQDAKLGIFVHWTPASVPGFAPVDMEINSLMASGRRDALAWSPYAEWYENSLRFADSPVAQHHATVYGGRPYTDFAAVWEAALEQWDPDAWAARFAATGARYVVLVTKHHDGYCLWPSGVANPHRANWHASRDVVGELGEAVRAAGLRFGVYYSGGLDWTFDDRPMGSFADMIAAIPRADYPAYADAQVRELIARYRPSVLWNDIAWPAEAKRLWELFEHYYRQVPDGVVNDRWMPWNAAFGAVRLSPVQRLVDAGVRRQARRATGVVPPRPPHFDVRTPEYTVFPDVQRTPWESVRGMDHSFGFNAQSRGEDFLSHDELLWSFVDIVAKGGNLLINVGPRGRDAQISDEQLTRLQWLTDWMDLHRDAVHATRPWITSGTTTADGLDVRYTARDDSVFAFVRRARASFTLAQLGATPTTCVSAGETEVAWRETEAGIRVDGVTARGDEPVVLRFVDVVAR
ncbi:MAG: alpha-L-fucosidase [Acidimicrobiia bacterium]